MQLPSGSECRWNSEVTSPVILLSSQNSSEDGSTTVGDIEESNSLLPESEKETSQSRSQRTRLRLLNITGTVLATFLVIVLFQIAYNRVFQTPQQQFTKAIGTLYSEEARLSPKYHCGNSSIEALAQGCVFDISVLGWVLFQCRVEELQRFLDFGWTFFRDEEGTREVCMETLAASAGTREKFWVMHRFHVTHCELAWQRMHRALQAGKRLTTHLLKFEHTHHRGGIVEMRDDLYSINSKIMPLLNTC